MVEEIMEDKESKALDGIDGIPVVYEESVRVKEETARMRAAMKRLVFILN